MDYIVLLNQLGIYNTFMCLSDVDTGGNPKRTSLGWRLGSCFTLFHLDLKVSMNKENMCLRWESELPSSAHIAEDHMY